MFESEYSVGAGYLFCCIPQSAVWLSPARPTAHFTEACARSILVRTEPTQPSIHGHRQINDSTCFLGWLHLVLVATLLGFPYTLSIRNLSCCRFDYFHHVIIDLCRIDIHDFHHIIIDFVDYLHHLVRVCIIVVVVIVIVIEYLNNAGLLGTLDHSTNLMQLPFSGFGGTSGKLPLRLCVLLLATQFVSLEQPAGASTTTTAQAMATFYGGGGWQRATPVAGCGRKFLGL